MNGIVALSLLVIAQAPAKEAGAGLGDEYRAVIASEAEALDRLAARYERDGRGDDATKVRSLIETEPKDGRTRFRILPEYSPKPEKLAELPAEAVAIRAKSIQSLMALALKAGGRPHRRLALADRALRDVLWRDPNQPEARRLIGYLAYEGGWATPHAVELLKKGYVPHPRFGWVLKSWVLKLDDGLLPGSFTASGAAKDWIPAAEADAQHASWEDAWVVDTAPHFQIRSNVPLDEAVDFAARLEAFHQMFTSLFADLIGPERLPLAQRIDNKKLQPAASTTRFAVSYFAEKSEYVNYLRTHFGLNEDVSLGYYMTRAQARRFNTGPRSFFYKDVANPIAAHATLYHESSHQILFESAGSSSYDKLRSNFWIWEGLGTYFETVEPQPDGTLLVGGLVGPRIAQARARILDQKGFVPLAKFAAMDERRFQDETDDAVYHHYAQAMALAVYLLDGEGQKYREPFLQMVADAYKGRVPKTLADRLGVRFDQLDAGFLKFLAQPANP